MYIKILPTAAGTTVSKCQAKMTDLGNGFIKGIIHTYTHTDTHQSALQETVHPGHGWKLIFS